MPFVIFCFIDAAIRYREDRNFGIIKEFIRLQKMFDISTLRLHRFSSSPLSFFLLLRFSQAQAAHASNACETGPDRAEVQGSTIAQVRPGFNLPSILRRGTNSGPTLDQPMMRFQDDKVPPSPCRKLHPTTQKSTWIGFLSSSSSAGSSCVACITYCACMYVCMYVQSCPDLSLRSEEKRARGGPCKVFKTAV